MRKVSLQAAVTRLSLTLPTPVTRMCSTLSVATGGSRSLETLFSEAAQTWPEWGDAALPSAQGQRWGRGQYNGTTFDFLGDLVKN